MKEEYRIEEEDEEITNRHWISYICGIEDIYNMSCREKNLKSLKEKMKDYLDASTEIVMSDYDFYVDFSNAGKSGMWVYDEEEDEEGD